MLVKTSPCNTYNIAIDPLMSKVYVENSPQCIEGYGSPVTDICFSKCGKYLFFSSGICRSICCLQVSMEDCELAGSYSWRTECDSKAID